MATKNIEIKLTDSPCYGMTVFEIQGREYAVGPVDQAEISARIIAKERLDLIDTNLLIQYSELPPCAEKLVELLQGDGWEISGVVDVLTEVIPDVEALAEVAIATQGKAVFLSFSDTGQEYSLADFPQYRDLILQGLGLPSIQGDDVRLYCLD